MYERYIRPLGAKIRYLAGIGEDTAGKTHQAWRILVLQASAEFGPNRLRGDLLQSALGLVQVCQYQNVSRDH